MRLLSFETIDGQEGSYNDLIKQLVRKTRHYYSEVSGDEFKMAVPELKAMEAKIQHLDRDFGNEKRDYLNDIIEELGEESDAENLLIDELKRTATVLIPHLDAYDQHYILTLTFKLNNCVEDDFKSTLESKLAQLEDLKFERHWYYSVGYIEWPEDNFKSLGVEVFGTFKNMKESLNNL